MIGTRTLTSLTAEMFVNDANDADDGSYSKEAPATKKKRKKTGGERATKHNKTRRLNNTTINPDLVLRSGKRDTDGKEGNAYGYSGGDDDSDLDNDFFEEKRYEKLKAKLDKAHRWTTGEDDLSNSFWRDNPDILPKGIRGGDEGFYRQAR